MRGSIRQGVITVQIVTEAVRAAAQDVEDAAQRLPVGMVVAAVDAARAGVPGSQISSALTEVSATLERQFDATRAAWRMWSEGGQDSVVTYAATDQEAAARLAAMGRPGASVAV